MQAIGVSIHAPRARGDVVYFSRRKPTEFQFTPLVRGATATVRFYRVFKRFNSRPSCEGRRTVLRIDMLDTWFQFTPLVRGAT